MARRRCSLLLSLTVLCLLGAHLVEQVQADNVTVSYTTSVWTNSTVPSTTANMTTNQTCEPVRPCKDGVVIPMWEPQTNLTTGDRVFRGAVYMVSMCFMFLGVAIIADRFMSSIEVITSQERSVKVKDENGEVTIVQVQIWNKTVSNLTLMALGSSAPEILLAIIEIIGNNFEAGELGPATIVGSATFNLFVIIGLCCYVIPDGDLRRIKHLSVFFVTATWSIFAYIWMYIILAVTSYGEVEIWEGLLTFAFFPITVFIAWLADRKIFHYKFLSKKISEVRGTTRTVVSTVEMQDMSNGVGHFMINLGDDADNVSLKEFERHRNEYIDILRELRKENPDMTAEKLEDLAEFEVMNRGPKSRAFYRFQATKKLTGRGTNRPKVTRQLSTTKVDLVGNDVMKVFFEPGHYTVMENIGTFYCQVARTGDDLDSLAYVDYVTKDGSATADTDYKHTAGTLEFAPKQTHVKFPITIIDDEIFEEDKHFYVQLSNIRVADSDGQFSNLDEQKRAAQLVNPSIATVMILDDDHAGIFHFNNQEEQCHESCGQFEVRVVRSCGARGKVTVPYYTQEGKAQGGGVDYEDAKGELIFDNDVVEGYITIDIVDHEEYEKDKEFFIVLGEPKQIDAESRNTPRSVKRIEAEKQSLMKMKLTEEERNERLGVSRLGEISRCEVHIHETEEFKKTVDKLLKKAKVPIAAGRSTWQQQFIDAVTVNAGDDDDDDDDEEKEPTKMDYVMHYLNLFWKLLFATVPPPELCGGKACFFVSMAWIGVLTAVIGDLASSFGCSIGLKDSVTAITFVALGTSLPDTFASKIAAIQDPVADASIGNVTGSNAVNVFLGIGIAWTIAAIKHKVYGTKFVVDPGSLAFAVTVFAICAFIACAILVFRRRPPIGGELGGPKLWKTVTTCVFFSFWAINIVLSSLQSYCHIKGF